MKQMEKCIFGKILTHSNVMLSLQILEFQAVHLMLEIMQLPGSRYLITLMVTE